MPIVTGLTFSDGAEFRFRESDMNILDEAAVSIHGAPVSELKIGKAGVMLFTGYMSTIYNGAIEIRGVVIDSELDGKEATRSATDKALFDTLNDQMRTAVVETGRLAVSVFADDTTDPETTAPSAYFEVLSDARKQQA